MRIEAYSQISQVYNTSKASRTKGSGSAGKKDEVQISRAGRDYQVAKQAVAEVLHPGIIKWKQETLQRN